MAGPAMPPRMKPPCQVAAARPRCDCGATRSSSESAATVNIALPTPPAARSARNTGKLPARPASPVVTATISSPAASTTRSPNRSTSVPPLNADTNRKKANALTASPTAVVPTPKARANSGMAGATMPKPERDHEGDDGEDAHLAGELAAGQESHGAGSSHARPRAPGGLAGHGR